MKKLLIGLVLMLGFVVNAQAFEIVSVNSVEVRVSYVEPTENTDNSPLTDLGGTIVYYSLDGTNFVEAMGIEPTSPTGGGTVIANIPVPVGEGQEADVHFHAKAVDGSGNMSGPSNTVVLRIDRLAPKAPQ